ncbi:MAG: hypothetical protein GF341_08215 [candidate division Zixibacteria bacterium]|nr:hypothetical protein [candidate division Zixibacteria bacterium]
MNQTATTSVRSLSCTTMMLAVVCIVGVLTPPSTQAFNVDSCHWAQWDTVIALSPERPAARFGIYAYRSLAVAHPEVYLQSDSLFADIIGRIPGSRSTWRGADMRNVEIFRRVWSGEARGPSFSFRDWAPISDSIGDEGLVDPNQSWLDRRLPSAAVLLHGPVQRLSTAEAAMLRYTQYRAVEVPAESLYVVIDTAGHGYLAKNSEIVSVKTRHAVDDPTAIAPALVFNEHDAYYPLFERDDRERSPSLKRIAALLGAGPSPALTEPDTGRVAQLRKITALHSEREKALAARVALGAVDVSLDPIAEAWRTVISDSAVLATYVDGMVRTTVYWANRLSKQTAEFAALITGPDLADFAPTLEDAYLELCGRLVDPTDSTNTELEAGGFIWSFEMMNLTLDDLIRLRTGQPSSQALAMAAILDCRNIENTLVEFANVADRPARNWVLAGHGRWQFNLGRWTHVPDSVLMRRDISIGLESYMIDSRYTGLAATGVITEADELTTLGELSDLVTLLPAFFLHVPSPQGRLRDIDYLIFDLTNEEIDLVRLPWPQFGDDT